MKKLLAALVLVLAFIVCSSESTAGAPVFKCFASSNSAYGYGWAASPHAAGVMALRECAINTPYGDICYVRWCVREY